MRDLSDKNADKASEAAAFAQEKRVALRAMELDVGSDDSVRDAVEKIIAEHGRIDVLMHNAGHMMFGPAEAFTPEQLAQQYDVNVLSTQRVNRAALPHMRKARRGLLIWNSSSSVAGGTPPYLGPYFAAKAGMDALAVIYARELALWGIERRPSLCPARSPRARTTLPTPHFANAGHPADDARAGEYVAGPYAGFGARVQEAFAGIVPDDADPVLVANAVVAIVAAPPGRRPFRMVVDPTDDGAAVGFAVTDRLRAEMLTRTGLNELLRPRSS